MHTGHNLADRVAVVTGGSRGIGRDIVAALRRAGAIAVVWDRDLPAADATDGIAVDVTDRVALEGAVATVRERHGRIDILVNNAGYAGSTVPVVDYPEDEWRRILEVNLTGTFLVCRTVVPTLVNPARSSIPSTRRGPGREKDAAASTATIRLVPVDLIRSM